MDALKARLLYHRFGCHRQRLYGLGRYRSCFPIWLKFKGGKGVATGMAESLPFRLAGLVMALSWLLTAFVLIVLICAALLCSRWSDCVIWPLSHPRH